LSSADSGTVAVCTGDVRTSLPVRPSQNERRLWLPPGGKIGRRTDYAWPAGLF